MPNRSTTIVVLASTITLWQVKPNRKVLNITEANFKIGQLLAKKKNFINSLAENVLWVFFFQLMFFAVNALLSSIEM